MDGGEVVQETRLWDPDQNRSTSMRGKEDAHDYRYFPDPDLSAPGDRRSLDRSMSDKTCPNCRMQKQARFMDQYGLPAYDAERLTASRELADYFEACLNDFPHPKPVSNWIMGPLLGLLNAEGKTIDRNRRFPPSILAGLLQLIDQGVISGKIAKTVFDEMAATGQPAKQIVEAKGLVQVTDADAIEAVVASVCPTTPRKSKPIATVKPNCWDFSWAR